MGTGRAPTPPMIRRAAGPAPGKALNAETLAPLRVRAGSAAPPPSGRQGPPRGSSAGGGSGPPPARWSGSHRHSRHTPAPLPEGRGDPRSRVSATRFREARRTAPARAVGCSLRCTNPAERLAAAGAPGEGLREMAEGTVWLPGSTAENSSGGPQRCRRPRLRRRHCAASVRAARGGGLLPACSGGTVAPGRANPAPTGPLRMVGYSLASLVDGLWGKCPFFTAF